MWLCWDVGYTQVSSILLPPQRADLTTPSQALTKVFRKAVEANARRLKLKRRVEKDDILAGLTAVTVRLAEPQFEGQTKRCSAPAAADCFKVVADQLTDVQSRKRCEATGGWTIRKIVAEMKSRIMARTAKD